jgi:hypothetical protein
MNHRDILVPFSRVVGIFFGIALGVVALRALVALVRWMWGHP